MSQPPLRRAHDRPADALRALQLELGPLKFAEGSALLSCGDTRVLAAASIERRVPPFREGSGAGWVTAEYSMLPRATQNRNPREVNSGRVSGRTAEIQRLIGRALRAVVDLSALGELTVTLDCHVLQADGGTRTASITAAYCALVSALGQMFLAGDLKRWPITDRLAAVSVGLYRDLPVLDLDYHEDSEAQADMNVVATGGGRIVEVQATAERRTISRPELDALLELALSGITRLTEEQARVLSPTLDAVAAVESRGPRRRAPPKDERELWRR